MFGELSAGKRVQVRLAPGILVHGLVSKVEGESVFVLDLSGPGKRELGPFGASDVEVIDATPSEDRPEGPRALCAVLPALLC
jgi:hypothetical protein